MGLRALIVLDTHALIWWSGSPSRLGRASTAAIARAERIGVPAVSCYEVASAVERGRLAFDRDVREWLEYVTSLPRIELLPLTPAVAVTATRLMGFHGDPADRLIVATAILEGAPLVTKDAKIRAYPAVTTIW